MQEYSTENIINLALVGHSFSGKTILTEAMLMNAEVPQATMQNCSTSLQSMSSGRGMFKQESSHYEDMHINEAEKVISHYQSERALGH